MKSHVPSGSAPGVAMRRALVRGAVALLVLVASGCALVPTRPPQVSLAGVDLIGANLVEQRFGLELRVQNPNDAALPIDGLSFEVDVNGEPFARGVSDERVTVPRYGEALLKVQAVSNLGRLFRQLSGIAKSGRPALDYRIRGRVSTTGFGSIPFESRGEFGLKGSED